MKFRIRMKAVRRGTLALASTVAIAGCSSLSSMTGVSGQDIVTQQPNATIQTGEIIGGGTKQMALATVPVNGFLPKPELLAPGGPGKADFVYLNPQIRMSSYRKVMIEPVTIWASPNSNLSSVPADQKRAAANAAYADIYNALNSHCEMVQQASPGTIVFRFALVDTKESNAVLDTVATYAPYGASTAYSVASVAFNNGVGYFAGTATGEGFAIDAMNGTLLWEAVDKRGGTTTLVANTLDDWRDVRHVFEAWGIQLRTRLRELGVCSG